MARRLDYAVAGGLLLCIASCLGYYLAFWVFQVQSLTCFRAPGGIKPFVEHQVVRDVAYVFGVSRLLERVDTPYQSVEVYDHPYFGSILVIDGSLQITERDEANYHEMMAHVPLVYLPAAKKVLMIGGGDGGAVLRALQHPIQEAVLVDIDMVVMRRLMQRHFSYLYRAYMDPRTAAYNMDGARWLADQLDDEDGAEPFDVVMVDSTDYGAADSLFTDQFYRNLARLMSPTKSILILNVDSPSWNMDVVVQVQRQLARVFRYAFVYHAHQPTFLSGHYAFLFASDTVHPLREPIDWAAWHRRAIATYYYTPDIHYAAFALPNLLRAQLTARAGRLGSSYDNEQEPVQPSPALELSETKAPPFLDSLAAMETTHAKLTTLRSMAANG